MVCSLLRPKPKIGIKFKLTLLLYSYILLSSIYICNTDWGIPVMVLAIEAAVPRMLELVSNLGLDSLASQETIPVAMTQPMLSRTAIDDVVHLGKEKRNSCCFTMISKQLFDVRLRNPG